MKIVAVEANIAAGKTTLLAPLAQALSEKTGTTWKVIREPVDEDPVFLELLKVFVENPEDADARVAFQLYITRSRQGLLKDVPEGNYVIERSLFSDIVFCHVNFLMAEQPSARYMSYFYQIKAYLNSYPKIDLVVYIDRDAESCFNACRARGRAGESQYTLDYFKDLKAFHDACLPQITRQYGSKLLTCRVDRGFACPNEMANAVVEHLE
ncbi:deoxynucleoside kinase [Shimwellia blattae]|uniref:Deoxynucleoside kinase-like protein n=1 Tax=Shimwellia blattae (strain ATCC 29907 / DSM 4481 / JCM 1650 / NBRC 105725 / CDC 9005-74) TaxID=630626 RepID=I2B5F9_SHIBC|nr:deoxynucleoside kinase [Shimwellia blattae]AFJ45763.1 deoxynucleoside kinase-like protein [Shimwellia blattae DSM 4481 = NBRC 105725]GAB83211.1 putative deoxynucleoside kinase [Shimwellia blattae DSM 4481 = NBRC 105725]VDY63244.1 Deoxyadenosine/deoxycytidine kinase [Shimwellia blattae]VEC20950.1 Deoxyadenosine/deoxycytidine kinase [Shimwellia blattae]